MSEPVTTPPLNSVACEACHQPLGQQHYRFGEQPVCVNCAGQLHAMQEHNRFAAGPWFLALLVGIITAIVCGAVWAAIAKATNFEIGIVAVGVGILVSMAIVKVSGNRRGKSIQIIAVACSVLGIWAGKGIYVDWIIVQGEPYAAMSTIEKVATLVEFFIRAPFITFGFFDVLWYLLAIRAAWQIAKAPPMQLHGPYPTSAPAPTHGLQFETVEPIQPPPQMPPQVPR